MAEIIRSAWMTDEMYQEWLGYFQDAGGTGVLGAGTRAIEQFRASANYERYFPGIKREDGSVRFINNPEQSYYENIQAYRKIVVGLKLNPDIFSEDYIDLITGDVSPNEFAAQASSMQARVLSQGPAIRDWYAANVGINFTPEGVLASLMSSRVDNAVLNRQISMAEIGGESVSYGFDLSSEFVNMLAEEGMDRNEADRYFGSAAKMLPTLRAIAARNADSSDPFNIMDYIGAEYLNDPEASSDIQRLKAQESSQFTGGTADIVRSRTTGGVTGLEDV